MLTTATPIKGGKDLQDLLTLINNADEFQKKLKALSDAEASARDEREKLTKAKDLDAAIQKANQHEQAAEAARQQATTKADQIIQQAKKDAQDLIDEARAKAKEISDKSKQRDNETTKALTEAKAKEEKATQLLNSAEQEHLKAQEARDNAEQLKVTYESKLKQLKTLMAEAKV